MAGTPQADQRGLYCSTSGTYFTDKESLADHYRSEYHRYNLKRKIANLAPVTRDWFEARREKLAATSGAAVAKIWVDPLTKKKFGSENTYKAFVNSKKYKDLVKQSGQQAPEPIVSLRRLETIGSTPQNSASQQNQGIAAPYHIKAANGAYNHLDTSKKQGEDAEEYDDDESGWETASDEDKDMSAAASANVSTPHGGLFSSAASAPATNRSQEDSMEEFPEWDVCRSLFDGHISESFEANLEYMWKKFGFCLPDADLLTDPEGLLKYLGAKLEQGHLPLYSRGDDANARQFPSLHAVQRHMADTGRFKMAWEDNEEEYADFYDFGRDMEEDGKELALASSSDADPALTTGGYELVVGGDNDGDGGKVLGHRQFARYYRQKYRADDPRQSATVTARVLSKYRMLGIATDVTPEKDAKRQQQRAQRKFDRLRLNTELRANVNRNLPRNVTY